MHTSLARFQDGVAQALFGGNAQAPPEVAAIVCQPGFAVYRNTVLKGCVDALQANYPAVLRLVGEEWFRAAAAVFARAEPPARPTLLYYGAGFPGFLRRFEHAAERPYLPGVAQLDRFWVEAHAARDEAPLDPAALAGLAPEELARTVLHPHATARWAWFAEQPIYAIWRRNREALDDQSEPVWRGEGALLVRAQGVVVWRGLTAAGCAFLDACAAGCGIAAAAQSALDVQGDADLARLMATLLEAGAFGRMGRLADAQ
jgi:hypothetical protein